MPNGATWSPPALRRASECQSGRIPKCGARFPVMDWRDLLQTRQTGQRLEIIPARSLQGADRTRYGAHPVDAKNGGAHPSLQPFYYSAAAMLEPGIAVCLWLVVPCISRQWPPLRPGAKCRKVRASLWAHQRQDRGLSCRSGLPGNPQEHPVPVRRVHLRGNQFDAGIAGSWNATGSCPVGA